MRSLIIAGGEFPPSPWLRTLYRPDDLVIAADRGGLLASRAHLPVSVLLGDFDSLPADISLDRFPNSEVRRFPRDKDYSDTELALRCAKEQGCNEAVIVGALGGRLDHCLFNVIAILELADTLGIPAELHAPDTQVRQLKAGQSWTLPTLQGWICSIIALDSRGTVSLKGLLYSGSQLVLERASTRGLSNEVTDSDARIEVHSGRMIVVLTNPKNEEFSSPGKQRAAENWVT